MINMWKIRYKVRYKAIIASLAVLFLFNDMAWAIAPDKSLQPSSTLSAESRFKPFFTKHGLDFQNLTAVIYAARVLKELIVDKNSSDEVEIRREINRLNRLFNGGAVKIDEELRARKLAGKEYRYAVFNFVKEKKASDVFFLKDYERLDPIGRRNLFYSLNIRDSEASFLDYPGLESVWFVGRALDSARIEAMAGADRMSRPELRKKPVSDDSAIIEFALTDPVVNRWDYTVRERHKVGAPGKDYIKPADYMPILENFIREEDGFMEETFRNIFGIGFDRNNIDNVRIEFIGEGGLKAAFLVTIRTKDGKRLAFSIKATKPWIDHEERNNILSSMYAVWKKLSAEALRYVARFGAMRAVYIGNFQTEIMVMSQEYIYGPTLRDIIDHPTLPYHKKLRSVKDAVECFMEAQRYGVSINDPKPENICLAYGTDKTWKIMDLDKIFTGPETAQTIIKSPDEYMALLRTYYGKYLDAARGADGADSRKDGAEAKSADDEAAAEFLAGSSGAIKNAQPSYIRARDPAELFDYLGIRDKSKDADVNSMKSEISQYFSTLGSDSELYAARFNADGNEYIWLSFFVEADNEETDIFAEYFYVNHKKIAHGYSDINRANTKLQMGIDDPLLKNKGLMQVFFDIRQKVIYSQFRPERYIVPHVQISSWEAFFFYVRRGYLPVDAEARDKVKEVFLRPWLKDRQYKIADPAKAFGDGFLDRCGPEFELILGAGDKDSGDLESPVRLPDDARTRVLIICDYNAERSPIAAAFLRDNIPDDIDGKVRIDSAGLNDMPQDEYLRQYTERDRVLKRHDPRKVTPEDIDEADIIFVMTSTQREQLEKEYPEISGKITLLIEGYDLNTGEGDYPDLEQLYVSSSSPYRAVRDKLAESKDRIFDRIRAAVSRKKASAAGRTVILTEGRARLLRAGDDILNKGGYVPDDIVQGDALWKGVCLQNPIYRLEPALSSDRSVKQITQAEVRSGYLPKHSVPQAEARLIETDNPYIIYTMGLQECSGLALTGKRNGKNVFFMAHIEPDSTGYIAKAINDLLGMGVTDIRGILSTHSSTEAYKDVRAYVAELNRENKIDLKVRCSRQTETESAMLITRDGILISTYELKLIQYPPEAAKYYRPKSLELYEWSDLSAGYEPDLNADNLIGLLDADEIPGANCVYAGDASLRRYQYGTAVPIGRISSRISSAPKERHHYIAPSILTVPQKDRVNEAARAIDIGKKHGVNVVAHLDVIDSNNGEATMIVQAGAKDTIREVTPASVAEIVQKSRQSGNSAFVDVHLMKMEPEEADLDAYIDAGAKSITIHWESFDNKDILLSRLRHITEYGERYGGVTAGLAVNPDVDIDEAGAFISKNSGVIGLVLQMSVFPGKGGQRFIENVLGNITRLREEFHYDGLIEIDGGINGTTARSAALAGVDIFVVGAAFFDKPAMADDDMAASFDRIMSAIKDKPAAVSVAPADNEVPAFAAALKEAGVVHSKNLEYAAIVPDKTILCHIITDSILPYEQRYSLHQLEQYMRGDEYSEKIVCLSSAGHADIVSEVRSIVAKQKALYKDYKVEFDIACPNPELVRKIVGEGLGVKALAFEPCREPVQIEGIMMALRALRTGDINKLQAAYEALSGSKLDLNGLGITDLDQFAARVVFVLPSAKKLNYDEFRRLNEIISKNIRSAA